MPGSTLPVSDSRTLLPVKTPAGHCCHDYRNQSKSFQGKKEPEVSLSAAVVSATTRLAFGILVIALQTIPLSQLLVPRLVNKIISFFCGNKSSFRKEPPLVPISLNIIPAHSIIPNNLLYITDSSQL